MVHPRILAWHSEVERQESSTKRLDHTWDDWSDMDADEAQEAFWDW